MSTVPAVQAPTALDGVTVSEASPFVQLPAVVYVTDVPFIVVGKVDPTVELQISPPPVVCMVLESLSQHITTPGCKLVTVDLKAAELALVLAPFKLTNTIEAKIPMIAMTIKSSIRVKPFLAFLFFFVFFILSPAFPD